MSSDIPRSVLTPLKLSSHNVGYPNTEVEKNEIKSCNGEVAPPKQSCKPLSPAVRRGYTDLINRTFFTFLMAYIFLIFISLGLFAALPIVVLIVIIIFFEVSRINVNIHKERQLPSNYIIKCWFLCSLLTTTVLYTVREVVLTTYPQLEQFYTKLMPVAFACVMIGIIIFVLSLRKGMYRYQFIQFTWTVMALLFTLTQAASQIKNMMRGMIWFLLPVTCVINNDIWAYIFGKLFGRTRLLSLSPKKTVEGFLGAFFFTVIWAFWFSGFLTYFPELYCSKTSLYGPMTCTKDPLFIPQTISLPRILSQLTGNNIKTVEIAPVQRHSLVLATFASLLAPFGGFFASGLKRAFKLKDFGDLIPGHGGMTDRMDCQGIMGIFTYVYLYSQVYGQRPCPSPAVIMQCAMALPASQKEELIRRLSASMG